MSVDRDMQHQSNSDEYTEILPDNLTNECEE